MRLCIKFSIRTKNVITIVFAYTIYPLSYEIGMFEAEIRQSNNTQLTSYSVVYIIFIKA